MRRVVTPELLDSDAGTAADIQSSLADLRRVNRWFGGNSTTFRLLQRVAQQTKAKHLSMLEVASGRGDVPQAAKAAFQRRGLTVDVILLDRLAAHLPRRSRALVSDALALPLADESVDVVSCVLFAHHLEPDEVVRFVDEALRVSRLAVLINDLVRHPMHAALIYAALPLFSRVMLFDSLSSV